LSWDAAATACCTTGTAVHVVRSRGQVCPQETVLVTGASGGVGLQAVQLARLDGARVIAVTSNPLKVDAVVDAGAQEVVVSPDLDFSAEVRRRTGGAGVEVAIEIVGSRTFGETLRCMASGGRVVVVGNLDTGSVSLNPGLVIVKELEILGAYATTGAELDEALGLLRSGELRPYVSEGLPLAQAARAHDLLERKQVTGRLVLLPT
jgi:NADPH:quinone reductase-like Zn-dependent oxidoreductase